MKIYDITRELTAAPVFPGDAAPQLRRVQQIALGDVCNLTELSLSAHNATHMDAPLHFIPDGASIDEIPPEVFCGRCRVVAFDGTLLGDEAERITAGHADERLLFKGSMEADISAAYVLSDAGLRLVGVEKQSVATAACTAAVHRHLLGSGVIILEGLDLSAVPEGEYFLMAAPMKIGGSDGAPVRALLAESDSVSPDIEPAFIRRRR